MVIDSGEIARLASLMMSLDGLERAERGDGIGRIKHGETEGDAIRRYVDRAAATKALIRQLNERRA